LIANELRPIINQKEEGEKMKNFRGLLTWLAVILATVGLTLVGCAGGYTPKNAPESFPCVADGKLDKTVAAAAALEDLSCSFKRWEGMETLHFSVVVKNVSSTPQRYRVNIFLDNGKAVGGLIPRKIAKGLVKPGETAKAVYPVGQMPKQPKAITLKIGTVGP
jgi:hypothetical protein